MKRSVRSFFQRLGPGFITGSSDNDPSGIATYSQAGAQFGLGMLWTSVISFPFMVAIQEMSARIAMVSGTGITRVLRIHYPKWLLWSFVMMLLVANTINIGANLGAMAEAATLILPRVPFSIFAVFFTFLILFLEIFVTYKTYANILKWFALTLLSYVATAFMIQMDWSTILFHTIVPTLQINRDSILMLVALFGTTISPYLFIWQSQEEIEEEISQGRTTIASRRNATPEELQEMRQDTTIGMAFSQFVSFFIIATAAMVFFRNGIHDIQTAADAARALEPLAGKYAQLLFSIGIIGTGLLAVPVLSASAAYALSDACSWSEGLYKKLRDAHGFYGVITISTLIGLLMNFIGIPPIKALIWTAVLNGIITAPIIAIMVMIANNKKIMGKHLNGKLSNTVCGIGVALMGTAAILLFIL